MATVHLYRRVIAECSPNCEDPHCPYTHQNYMQEVTARVLVLKRHYNIESLASWWKACRKALTGKDVPLEYAHYEVDPAWIRFKCADGTLVFVDRKRDML